MAYQYTESEFASKVDYEGGPFEALFGYGLSPEDLEPGDLRTTLEQFMMLWQGDVERAWEKFTSALYDVEIEED